MGVTSHLTHLHFGCYKQTSDPDELQHALSYVALGQHEAVKVVLCQVERLPVESVGVAHLVRKRTIRTKNVERT